IRAAYHTAHATMKSDITQTQTGIDERASARRGSNGASELKASTVKRTLPCRVECGRKPETRTPGPLCTRKEISSRPSRPLWCCAKQHPKHRHETGQAHRAG